MSMSRTATYHTTVNWKSEHWGHIALGNGPEMDFSAPPDAQGHPGVLTPEDAFVAAANTCIMMMFIWAAERGIALLCCLLGLAGSSFDYSLAAASTGMADGDTDTLVWSNILGDMAF